MQENEEGWVIQKATIDHIPHNKGKKSDTDS